MPFRSVAFRWLWSSSLASAGAQWMERTATAWLVLETGSGPLAVGLVFAMRMVPSLLFGLMAGTIADRSDRRRQILVVSGTALLAMVAFAWRVDAAAPDFWGVAAIAFVAGCLQVFDTPARQALVLDTVPRSSAPKAVALNAFATRLFGALGAFAGGAIIPALGVANCYLVVGAIYGLAAALAAAVQPPPTSRTTIAHPPFLHALRDAARLIVDRPAVRTLSIAGIACEVFAFSYMSAVPLLARDVLATDATGLGLLNGAAAIGGTLGVVLLSILPGSVRREPILAMVYLLYGASILLLASARDLTVAAAVLVVTGACAAAFDALQQTLIQLAVPEEQRGRAVGVWVLGLGSAPVGHLEMGTLSTALGAPGALTINGLVVVVGAVTLLARAPTYRWRPRAGTRAST